MQNNYITSLKQGTAYYISWNAIGGWDNYLNFMDKIFTGASQTTTFSPSKVSRYTLPFQKDVCLTKWCDCSTSYLELNLAIALVIAESHYVSGVIVALLLEGVIIIMELNMAVASLYYP